MQGLSFVFAEDITKSPAYAEDVVSELLGPYLSTQLLLQDSVEFPRPMSKRDMLFVTGHVMFYKTAVDVLAMQSALQWMFMCPSIESYYSHLHDAGSARIEVLQKSKSIAKLTIVCNALDVACTEYMETLKASSKDNGNKLEGDAKLEWERDIFFSVLGKHMLTNRMRKDVLHGMGVQADILLQLYYMVMDAKEAFQKEVLPILDLSKPFSLDEQKAYPLQVKWMHFSTEWMLNRTSKGKSWTLPKLLKAVVDNNEMDPYVYVDCLAEGGDNLLEYMVRYEKSVMERKRRSFKKMQRARSFWAQTLKLEDISALCKKDATQEELDAALEVYNKARENKARVLEGILQK